MKAVYPYIFVSMFIVSSSVCAQSARQSVIISVKGLVCEFCVKTIEKVFRKQDEVADVSINLGKALVTVTFKEKRSIDDAGIKRLVKEAGYDASEINRRN